MSICLTVSGMLLRIPRGMKPPFPAIFQAVLNDLYLIEINSVV